MNRLMIGLQAVLLLAVLVLLVRTWPSHSQPYIPPQTTVAVPGSEVEPHLPEMVVAAFAEVERTLSGPSTWPTKRDDIEKLQEKLKSAVNALSPRDQEFLLPRLVPRRWEIQALWLLAKENDPADTDIKGAKSLADEVDLLNTAAPLESSDDLRQQLKRKEQELRVKVAVGERSLAVEQARAALSGKGGDEVDGALRQINGFDDEESRRLGYQLGLRRDMDAVLADLDQLEKLTDPLLKEYGLAKLNQTVMDLRLRVAMNVPTLGSPDRAAERLSTIEKSIAHGYEKIVKIRRAEATKRARDYQIWALTQIKSVQTFKVLKDVEIAKIGSLIDRNIPMSNAHESAVERAMTELDRLMVSRLAPINQGVLDEAVATWYRKVFQERFDSLNDAHKLSVVTGFASAEKRQIDE
jgi:hypothetical protein